MLPHEISFFLPVPFPPINLAFVLIHTHIHTVL